MAYEKTWNFAHNVEPTGEADLTEQCRDFMMQLKDYLVASAGWTVTESCDSVSVGGAGVDKWDALTDIVAATGAHSWMVLKSPEGMVAGADGTYTGDQSRLWFCINMRYTNYYQCELIAHRVAPTGGTTSAPPTSTNQIAFSSQQFNRTTLSTNTKFHFSSVAEGGFIAMLSYAGLGTMPFVLMLMNLVDPVEVASTTFDYPYAAYFLCAWQASGLGAFSRSIIGDTTTGRCWAYTGNTSYASINALGNADGWMGSAWGSSGDFNSFHDASDIWITAETAGYYGRIGRMADIFATGVPSPQGLVDNASPSKAVLGNLHIPTDSVLVI